MNTSDAFTKSYYATELMRDILVVPTSPGKPAWKEHDRSALFFEALRSDRPLTGPEIATLVTDLAGDARALMCLGIALLRRDKAADAQIFSDRAGPSESGYFLQAAIEASRRRFPQAAERLEKSLATQERNHRAWYILAICRMAMGQQPAAANAMYKALRQNVSNDNYLLRLLEILSATDSRRSLIVQLKDRPSAERSKWIAGTDLYFKDDSVSYSTVSAPESEHRSPLTENDLKSLPELASFQTTVAQLETFLEDNQQLGLHNVDEFFSAQDPPYRAQIAASLFCAAKRESNLSERVLWLGRFAFALADRSDNDLKCNLLLTFLWCSFYCNSDEPLRSVALRHYLNAAKFVRNSNDPWRTASDFLRQPLAEHTIWAARLALALRNNLLSRMPQLSAINRKALTLAFLLSPLESIEAKLGAIEYFAQTSLSFEGRSATLDLVRSLIRAGSLPASEDRLLSIIDARQVLEQRGQSLPTFAADVFGGALDRLEADAKADLSRNRAPIHIAANLDLDGDRGYAIRMRFTNSSRTESRNIRISLTSPDVPRLRCIAEIASLASGESQVISETLDGHDFANEICLDVSVNTSGSIQKQANFVLTRPDMPLDTAPLENPYLTGMPIPAGDRMFFGRSQELIQLSNLLRGQRISHIPFVYGQRRTGKTSLLNRLSIEPAIKEQYLFALLDCEMAAGQDTAGYVTFFQDEISRELDLTEDILATDEAIRSNPLEALRRFFERISKRLTRARLLLAFDEFETLLSGIRSGAVSPDLLGVLRGFMQHNRRIAFLVAGADELVERARDYASPLFFIAKPVQITYLSQNDVDRLVREPLQSVLTIGPDVVESIMKLTNGHPHLAQLLCHYSITELNERRRRRLTSIDIDAASETIIAQNDSYFYEIFQNRCSVSERLVLAALADLGQRGSLEVSFDELYALLKSRNIALKPETLRPLQDRQLVIYDAPARKCRFQLEMLRRWIIRKYPFHTMASYDA